MTERYNAKSVEFCACTNCELENAGVECIASNLLSSPEGQVLVRKQRWGSFAWEDRVRFEQYLGPDINNFWHGPHQAKEIALPFIEHQNAYAERKIDKEDARLLMFLNCVHDIQEAIHGDVPKPLKTAESDALELNDQLLIVSRVFNLPHHDPLIWRLREVQEGGNFLSWAFNAIEHAGYLQTALRAWALKDHTGLEPEEREKCFDLGHAVLTKNVPQMEQMVEFPYMRDLLARNRVAIEQAGACN